MAAPTSSGNSPRTETATEVKQALWELIWAGWVTGDTFAPVRAMLAGTGAAATPVRRRTGNASGRPG